VRKNVSKCPDPRLNRDCIIGINTFIAGKCTIDVIRQIILFNQNNNENAELTAENTVTTADIQELYTTTTNFDEALEKITEITELQKSHLNNILQEHAIIFRAEPGRICQYEHRLKVTDPTPFFQKGWPVPIAYQEKVDSEIRDMLRYGVIERANSPYINPLVVVVKKDKSVRVCLDARKLNSVTIPDYEGPLPIQELLANCGGIRIMSSIDLRSSFWQIPLHQESRDFTGFMYRGKTYRFTVTPFGLKTSSASLTRGLDAVLNDEVKKFTIMYVDDCLCISRSVEEHLEHLELLFKNLKEANLTINLKKSQFFRKEINYLGYRLSTEGIATDPDKVSAIQNFPRPRNQKQLKGFLGLTNFYNRFTSRYAE